MAYKLTLPATNIDPEYTILKIDKEEVIAEVERVYREESITPDTIHLIDEYTANDIEIEVSEYLDYTDLVSIEKTKGQTDDKEI